MLTSYEDICRDYRFQLFENCYRPVQFVSINQLKLINISEFVFNRLINIVKHVSSCESDITTVKDLSHHTCYVKNRHFSISPKE